ncbi:MAG: hypothetical protein PHF86_01135 [Candidatus Nanoarchaeia archaeon]|nr:hypothetical protein [Candidatus Nanoarchaeia archaeon]
MKIVRESLFEFERNEDPYKSLSIGSYAKPMKERSKEFNKADRQKAIEYLETSGIIKVAPMSNIQENHLTLKLQLLTPYWFKRNIKIAGEWINLKDYGIMYYFIQNGYLRKYPPEADRTQVIVKDNYASYLDLAKILVEKAKYDMKKSEIIKKSDLPNNIVK